MYIRVSFCCRVINYAPISLLPSLDGPSQRFRFGCCELEKEFWKPSKSPTFNAKGLRSGAGGKLVEEHDITRSILQDVLLIAHVKVFHLLGPSTLEILSNRSIVGNK